jgi:hypothetical protein
MRINVTHIAVKPKSDSFAVSVVSKTPFKGKKYGLLFFDSFKPCPTDAVSMPDSSFGITFVQDDISYFDHGFQIIKVVLGNDAEVETGVVEAETELVLNSLPRTVFGSTYGRKPTSAKVASVDGINGKLLSFLETPSHIIAPPSKLSRSILEAFISKRAQEDTVIETEAIVPSTIASEVEVGQDEVDQIVYQLPQSFQFLTEYF